MSFRSNTTQRKSCRLIGFEIATSYYEETKTFYKKLGFIVHKEVEDKTTKSIWLRDQRFEPDIVDERTSFFVFTWKKEDAALQVLDNALPRDVGFMLTIHTNNILGDFEDVNNMKMELGCWVENQPVDVVDKDILVGTVIDPNGMTLQFIQFSNKRFYVEEDVGNDKNTHLGWDIKFGDLHVQVDQPERTGRFLEKVFSSTEDRHHLFPSTLKNEQSSTKSSNAQNINDSLDGLVSSTPIQKVEQAKREGIYIVDREDFPTAATEFVWCGSCSRSISSSLCLYSRRRRSADIVSLAKTSTITSKEEKKHLLIGCLISVNDLSTFTKMIDVHSMAGGDVSRLLEVKKIVTSIEMNNDRKTFVYHPKGKIPLKLKLFTSPMNESQVETKDEQSKEVEGIDAKKK
jgi:hypothetical protein